MDPMGIGGTDQRVQDSHSVSILEDLHAAIGSGPAAQDRLLVGGQPEPDHPCRARDVRGGPRPQTGRESPSHPLHNLDHDPSGDVVRKPGQLAHDEPGAPRRDRR